MSHKLWLLPLLVLVALLSAGAGIADAAGQQDSGKKPVREIFVPFEDLNVLLEKQPRRVLLKRDQYEDLLKKAKKTPESHAPRAAVLVSADYNAVIRRQRAELSGTLVVDVLQEGLHAVPLDFGGVGLRSAKLDGQSAPIGRTGGGKLTLLVEGAGRHRLTLEMVAPLETTAARQVLNFRLPRPPAARLRLTVPGDVEVKSGAEVAARAVDDAAGVTRFELLPQRGDTTLVMSLNSRLLRRQRAVVARSVLVDEVTQAYEKLHAAVSLGILHRAVDRFRFVVPEGFEITEVSSPLLARWDVEEEADRKVLNVRLREQTTETVLLNLSAIKTPSRLEDWRLPRLEPLDVLGQVAVVGLLVEERLKAESLAAEGLIPIDTEVLSQALPETIFHAAPGTPPLRPVVAYYAPQGEFSLAARFDKPPAKTAVTTSLLLILADKGHEVMGGLAILPEVEKRFAFDFSVPPGWQVLSVTGPGETPLEFERYGPADGAGRINVRTPQGIPAGEEYHVNFHAVHTPPDWLADWQSRPVEFPVFAIADAARDEGAIAVEARDDMTVRPEKLVQLTPLDEAEQDKYGLAGVQTNLAYRYENPRYEASLVVERTPPRLTARTFSFLEVKPDGLAARYELIYTVQQARTRRLSLLLPEDTPETLSIRGLDGVKLKEYDSQPADGARRWRVLLEKAARDNIRLAVEFSRPLAKQEPKDLVLPIVSADGVVYQSGVVAVEGSAELEVKVKTAARPLDVGELVDADYQPGKRLLGAYGFVGDPAEVKIDVFRHPGYRMGSAIVELATMDTYVSPDGAARSEARFALRTKALYLEVDLPGEAVLWSARLDRTPIKPQREGKSLLVSLPAAAADAARSLQIVYAAPVAVVGRGGRLTIPAPKLRLRAERDTPTEEVPLADLVWRLHLPTGYAVTRSAGTLTTDEVRKPTPAAAQVAGALCLLAGSLSPLGMIGCGLEAPRAAMPQGLKFQLADSSESMMGEDAGYFETLNGAAQHVEAPATEAPPQPTEDEPVAEEPEAEDPLGEEPADEEEKPEEGGEELEKDLEREKETAEETRSWLQADMDVQGDGDEVTALPPVEPPLEGVKVELEDFGLERAPRNDLLATAGAYRETGLGGRLTGVASLWIELDQVPDHADRVVTFQSLGAEPLLDVTLSSRARYETLGWGLALAVGLIGLAITNRTARRKVAFIVAVGLVATLLPLAADSIAVAEVCNMVFFAAAWLVPYYLAVAAVKWLVRLCRRLFSGRVKAAAAAATAAVLLAAAVVPAADAAPQGKSGRYVVQVVEPAPPVDVPQEALILPYDPDSKTGIEDADRLLVPYARYVELWNRAYPKQKIEERKIPAPYALAGASYTTMLQGEEYLLLLGELEIDVYADGYVTVPLGLAGGVLARAELDGKPARLSVASPAAGANGPPQQAPQAANQADAQAAGPAGSLLLLYATGRGRHKLEVAVRLRLSRQGGWRVAEGRLPAAPATALEITVPEVQTEVRLGRVADRPSYETEQPDETIDTALGDAGQVSIRWRPKVAEGEVDRSLTARSAAVLDVQEDGLRLVWQLTLEFRRSQREQFSVELPEGYLLEKVEGENVRGWELRGQGQRQTVEITLLKAAKDQERFTLRLWRGGAVGRQELAEFDFPLVNVADAALHNGRLTIRRSPLLELRTTRRSGVTRTDLGRQAAELADGPGSEESPLGIRPYQAYRFVTTPFSVRLAAAPVEARKTATVQTVLKIAEYERSMESRVNVEVQGRAIHRVEMFVPEELKIERVVAPAPFQWAVTEAAGRRLLTVYLATGRQGEVAVLISGELPRQQALEPLKLPRLEIRNVARQEGDIAVQVDPAVEVTAKDAELQNCEKVLLGRLHGWLTPKQRPITRLALHYRRADYAGTLRFLLRKADVVCDTITNVRVTDRAVEETILLQFQIQNAGIGELSFLLPAWMGDSRIKVPGLRQKTIKPAGDGPDAPLRVRLELQDEVMGERQVVVENDRLLTPRPNVAPVPTVETGRTNRRYVVLQSAGSDEVVVRQDELEGLEPLGRQQKEWGRLKSILPGDITQAYLVSADAERPRLVFTTKGRKAVETAGAGIGLSETHLVLDANGAYRAEQIYHLDNSTEQFLEIALPLGARLWTAWVAGAPVKPTRVPAATDPRGVRIPLVKTAPGDLDYEVVLQYGGKMPRLGALGNVEFPLVHTVNITPARSLVWLYLPETHRWFDFGGTMRPVEEEGDMAAGYISYQTEQVKRLMRTMRGQSDFAKVRAMSNLKSLESELQHYTSRATEIEYPNVRLQTELQTNAGVLLEAGREAQQQQLTTEQDGLELSGDNRYRLNAVYEGQKTFRARNVVQDAGWNWEAEVIEQPSEDPGRPPVQFNHEWLYKNDLYNPAQPDKPERRKAPKGKPSAEGGKPGEKRTGAGLDLFRWKGKKAPPAAQPRAPEVAQGKAKAKLQEFQDSQAKEGKESRGTLDIDDDRSASVFRYQRKLEQQQQQQEISQARGWRGAGQRFRHERSRLDITTRQGSGTIAAGDRPQQVFGRIVDGDEFDAAHRPQGAVQVNGHVVTTARTELDGQPAATGLASLKLQLPRRGRVYRFTTPRGAVELSGRSVSQNLLGNLIQLGIVLAVVALVVYLVRVARRGGFAWLGSKTGGVLLICAGVPLLCLLPVAGLAAVAAGVVVLARLAKAKRPAPRQTVEVEVVGE